jgi:predicted ATP-dependent protease
MVAGRPRALAVGQQGVLIPRRNRRHLMLAPRLVDAVATGRFHIHTADHASEGMELLAQTSFGTLAPGGYPADTVLGRAQATLKDYRRACENLGERGRGSRKPRARAARRPARVAST